MEAPNTPDTKGTNDHSAPKSKRRSDVWDHFYLAREGRYQCRYCTNTFSKLTATTPLRYHLRSQHASVLGDRFKTSSNHTGSISPGLINQYSPMGNISPSLLPGRNTSTLPQQMQHSQMNTTSSPLNQGNTFLPNSPQSVETLKNELLQTSSPLKEYRAPSKDWQEALLDWLISDLQPFQVVERPSFMNFIGKISQGCVLPDPNKLEQLAFHRFQKEKGLFKTKILEEASKVALSVDLWTSGDLRSYLALSIQYIDNEWDVKTYFLDVKDYDPSSDGNQIAAIVYNVLIDYNLAGKVIAITSDNAPNLMAGMPILTSILQEKMVELKFYSCSTKILNLVVQEGLKNESVVVSKVRTVITYIKNSHEIYSQLMELQRNAARPQQPLELDNPVQWNSTFNMLKCFLNHQEVIQTILKQNADLKDHLNVSDWERIKQYSALLQPFNQAAEILTVPCQSTLGKVYTIFHGLASILRDVPSKLPLISVETINSMLHTLLEYWSWNDFSSLQFIPVVLDPRVKLEYFSDDVNIEHVKECLVSIIEIYSLSGIGPAHTSSKHEPETNSLNLNNYISRPLKRGRIYSDSNELGMYFASPVVPPDSSALEWWKTNQNSYPILSKIARDFLSISAMVPPPEQLFNSSNDNYSKMLARLDQSEIARATLCLSSWTRST
ncbi:hypothetical protein K7432_018654 [Basidiobolus ranarum]|uniref:BED-type domain-containing protein n=1 Tax=Basidiobolus ranarum TaxID=34480 RepID=A0ABR2WBT3_9FUNG